MKNNTIRPASVISEPPERLLSNEDIVVAICQPQELDRPQMLRLAAQFISRKAVKVLDLIRLARRERADRVLAELARQALKVDPQHEIWREIMPLWEPAKVSRTPASLDKTCRACNEGWTL